MFLIILYILIGAYVFGCIIAFLYVVFWNMEVCTMSRDAWKIYGMIPEEKASLSWYFFFVKEKWQIKK